MADWAAAQQGEWKPDAACTPRGLCVSASAGRRPPRRGQFAEGCRGLQGCLRPRQERTRPRPCRLARRHGVCSACLHGQRGQGCAPGCRDTAGTPPVDVSLLDDRRSRGKLQTAPASQWPTWHLSTRVPVRNWRLVFENSCRLPKTHPSLSLSGGDGQQVGARPGHAETGLPGTAVTLCHCGQLSAPAASCHHARHKTDPLGDAAGTGRVIN